MKSLTDVSHLLDVDRTIATDVLVIGTGVAGLAAALASGPRPVLVATKGRLASGSSPYAQGGIAAAVAPGDSPSLHAEDTERAGRGLSERDVVGLLTDEAPGAIRELESLGLVFDRLEDGALSLGREGGHGRNRVLHAGGDRTGAAIVEALVLAAHRAGHITLEEDLFVVDLLRFRGRVAGVIALKRSSEIAVLARDIVLATGGLGQIYRHTTNPEEVTGDGIAMAARAGALLADMEFVQFHPTALRSERAEHGALPLLTEALRGAGALVIDETGRRFLAEGELAPRDVVALGIFRHQKEGHEVFLDLRPVASLVERFPTVVAVCHAAGLQPEVEPVPITPAAHYAMGGVAVDGLGRTTLPGLWACGETASTGAHGANRLASNSLLEALVFGRRLARELRAGPSSSLSTFFDVSHEIRRPLGGGARDLDVPASRRELQELMWRQVGLERTGGGLGAAVARLQGWCKERESRPVTDRAFGELRNMTLVSALVALAARRRRESRGAHYRTDFPATRSELGYRQRLRLLAGTAPLEERVLFESSPFAERELVAAGGARR